jgi:hypothetical protein
LRVDDGGGGAGLAALPLPKHDDKVMAHRLPDTGLVEGPEIAIHRLPRREGRRGWQVAPLTPGTDNIEQAVQHPAHVRGPGPATRLGRRNERFDQAVLVIAERLTTAKVSNLRTILGRPHRGLQKVNSPSRTDRAEIHYPAKTPPKKLLKRALSADPLINLGKPLLFDIQAIS